MQYGYKHNTMYTACPVAMQEDNHICKQIKLVGIASRLVRENYSRDMLLITISFIN